MQRISNLMPSGPHDELVHRGARRQSTRYPLDGEVKITAPIEAEGFLFNASVGGMRIAIDRAVEKGALLHMHVHFTDERHSDEVAEVIWCRELPDGFLVGVRFVAGRA